MVIDKDSYFLFSGGEVHTKVNDLSAYIIMRDYTMNGFMALAETVQVLRRIGKQAIQVQYSYLPYARQDRVMAKLEPFSLKIFCDLLNTLKLDAVLVNDPHSDVVPALIDNCQVLPQWELARRVIPKEYFDDPEVVFVSPDAGAYKKVAKLISDDQRIALGTKYRDEKGNIKNTTVHYPTPLIGKTCVLVDDICDGGRTFIELAKILKINGAAKVVLYVTHGIFSQGFDVLKEYIDEIYTTDSFTHENLPDFVKVIKIC